MFWVNTVFTTALPLLCVVRQIKPFTEHQYGIIKCPLCIVLYGLWTTPLSLSVFPSLTHTRTHMHASFGSCVRCESRFEPSTGFFMTTVGEICWSHLQWASVTPFVTLGKSAKSKCGVSPVCVFNVPLLLSPMTRGGPPRVLALSPGVLSLLYLSTRHGRSPKDNHTCMLKKGLFFFSHLNTHRENQTS